MTSRGSKAEAVHPIIVRLPLPLYRKLQALAEKERRPVSLQALFLLEQALTRPEESEKP